MDTTELLMQTKSVNRLAYNLSVTATDYVAAIPSAIFWSSFFFMQYFSVCNILADVQYPPPP